MAKRVLRLIHSRSHVFVGRMCLFSLLSGFFVALLYADILDAFMANPALNGLILGVLLLGIFYSLQQVLRLYPEIRWVNSFRISDPGLATERPPVMLAPMATMFRRRQGQAQVSPVVMRSILDSIGSRLDESRETTRYLVGLLIFLGLLGTFWGLLQTIQSVGTTISSLNTTTAETALIFEELKSGLQAPLSGMGTAFSSSLFGLAGSLILGFLDLQASQAQNRFYNELEEWLSGITEMAPEGSAAGAMQGTPAQLRFAMLDMQRSITDLGEKIENSGVGGGNSEATEAIRELSGGIDRMVKQMRAEQKIVREWVDEQAQQQSELAAVLREQNQLAGALRDIAARAPRRER
ncbi:flagellar motor protein MotA [Thiohalocapsa sp.]|uniref:flagellar motor protein MotA n=1 Tax=Thiohalocapsa sp. TaxID=2497641 RepID=UPI0025D90A46|nr:flagellar motor protein MotA [Thiohalocapsa sp.]